LQAGFDHQAAAQQLETLGNEADGDGRLLGREIYHLGTHKRKRGGEGSGEGNVKPSQKGHASANKNHGGKAAVPRPSGRAPCGKTWDGRLGQWVTEGSSVGNTQLKPERSASTAGPAESPSSSGATKRLRRSSRFQVLFEEQQEEANNASDDDDGEGDERGDSDDDDDEDDDDDDGDERDNRRKGGGLSAYDHLDDSSSSEEEDDNEAEDKGFAEQEHRDDYFDQAKKKHKTSNKTLAKMEAASMDQVRACRECRCVRMRPGAVAALWLWLC